MLAFEKVLALINVTEILKIKKFERISVNLGKLREISEKIVQKFASISSEIREHFNKIYKPNKNLLQNFTGIFEKL